MRGTKQGQEYTARRAWRPICARRQANHFLQLVAAGGLAKERNVKVGETVVLDAQTASRWPTVNAAAGAIVTFGTIVTLMNSVARDVGPLPAGAAGDGGEENKAPRTWVQARDLSVGEGLLMTRPFFLSP